MLPQTENKHSLCNNNNFSIYKKKSHSTDFYLHSKFLHRCNFCQSGIRLRLVFDRSLIKQFCKKKVLYGVFFFHSILFGQDSLFLYLDSLDNKALSPRNSFRLLFLPLVSSVLDLTSISLCSRLPLLFLFRFNLCVFVTPYEVLSAKNHQPSANSTPNFRGKSSLKRSLWSRWITLKCHHHAFRFLS